MEATGARQGIGRRKSPKYNENRDFAPGPTRFGAKTKARYQRVRDKIRYAANQWNFSADQRISSR
jgi:hypothetical protein